MAYTTVEQRVLLSFTGDENHAPRSHREAGVNVRPTVVIVEDHLGCLEGVSKLIERDYEVVAVAGNGKRAITTALRCKPDVVILDVSLPELNGIAAAREMRKNGLKSKILFLTVHEEPEFKEAAFHSGANGYVYKSQMNADVLVALKQVLAGGTFVSRGPNE